MYQNENLNLKAKIQELEDLLRENDNMKFKLDHFEKRVKSLQSLTEMLEQEKQLLRAQLKNDH